MASVWIRSKKTLQVFILLFVFGCGRSNSPVGPEVVELDPVGPLGPAYRSLWTKWVKVDAAQIPETTGLEVCAAEDAGLSANACVNGGLVRKVKVPSLTNCSDVQTVADNLGAFKWECSPASDGSGLWIFSTGFLKDKGLGDLIEDAANSVWKELSVRIQTANKLYVTKPVRAWIDVLTRAPDTSSGRKELNRFETLYYIDSDTSGHGFTIAANNIGLVVLKDAKYTFTSDGWGPVVEGVDRKFVYLEGSFDGNETAIRVVDFRGDSAFLFINGLVATRGTSDGVYIGGEAYNLHVGNLKSSNNGVFGFKREGTGDYLELSFVETVGNGNIGFEIQGIDSVKRVSKVKIADLTSEGNRNGASLTNVDGVTVINVIFVNNERDGVFLRTASNVEVTDFKAFGQAIGIFIDDECTNVKFANVSITNRGELEDYAIFFEATASDAEFSNVLIKQVADDAVTMQGGAKANFTGISFEHVQGYLFSAVDGGRIDVYDLSYGAGVDPSKISFTNNGGQVVIH